ncbi:MAG: pyridoxal-phosphate dependent enzyme [Planctomycetes bacterium]|nr:pyridoxal-phosphate dependent enzyme [Planctomycetota bacterium]
MPFIAHDVSQLIGKTPMLRAARFAPDCDLLFKCEFMNPGGSIKDRIGFAMIEDAERRGVLKPGGTIVEATASNTGLALAMAAAVKGYKLVTVMTTKTSAEKVALMRAVGAEVVIVPREAPPDSPENFMKESRDSHQNATHMALCSTGPIEAIRPSAAAPASATLAMTQT